MVGAENFGLSEPIAGRMDLRRADARQKESKSPTPKDAGGSIHKKFIYLCQKK